MSKIKVNHETGCWEWQAAKNGFGYGIIRVTTGPKCSKNHRVHRLLWEMTSGSIQEGKVLCHKCDVPWCVNPDHLFLGTKLDNSRDMFSKKRHRTKPHYGELHPMAKLNRGQVLAIRLMRQTGATLTQISEHFSMSVAQIHNIVSGKHWA